MNGITENIPAFERGLHAPTLLLQAFGGVEVEDARMHIDTWKIITVRRELKGWRQSSPTPPAYQRAMLIGHVIARTLVGKRPCEVP